MSCDNYPKLPTVVPAVKRVIAIGDIHGDLDAAVRSFRLAKLIDDERRWIGSDTVVVQVGDQIDSCRPGPGNECHDEKIGDDRADDVTVIQFFDEMNEKAKEQGGAVYSLIGNHELLNAQGDFRYVSYQNMMGFDYQGETDRYEAFKPGGSLATHLACTRQSLIVIGSTLFVHAGLLPSLMTRLDGLNLDNRSKLKYINSMVRKWLLGLLPKSLQQTDLDWIEYHSDSPFWTRVYGTMNANLPAQDKICYESLQALQILQLGQLVVGHTPQVGVSKTCDTVYRIDTGVSKAFTSGQHNLQVLEILDDKVFNILSES